MDHWTILPSELDQACPAPWLNTVIVDTESSGLAVDDGARISCVSMAFLCSVCSGTGKSFFVKSEPCPTCLGDTMYAFAWPFDQGVTDGKHVPGRKRQKTGQTSLFDEIEAHANLPEEEWEALLDWLSTKSHVYHNAQYDVLQFGAGLRMGWRGADFLPNVVDDTLLAQWVLDPAFPSGLDDSAERVLGDTTKSVTKAALASYLGPKDNPRYDLVPWSVMAPYAISDAKLTLRLWLQQNERFSDEDARLSGDYAFELDVCRSIIGMVRRGIGYDIPDALEALADAQEKADQVAALLPFKPTVDEARKWFYVTCEAEPHCTTAVRGEPSVAECCVRTLVSQEIPGAKEWAQYQKVTGAISRWYEGFITKIGEDGRLRTDMRQNGTVSMRFSSQRVNLQALPHDYKTDAAGLELVPPRSLFRPREGCILVEMDLSQAELRYGAEVAKSQPMKDAIASGDPHGVTAIGLFQCDNTHPRWFEFRQIGKRSNFALEYSVGADTYMRDLEKQTGIIISRQESQRIITTWRNLYPEFPAVNRRAESAARKNGYIKLADGRRRYFRPYEELHKAFNQKVQGSIAQAMKRAMVKIDTEWPGMVLLQVHDSLVMEVPEAEGGWGIAHAACDLMSKVASEVLGVHMPAEVKQWH